VLGVIIFPTQQSANSGSTHRYPVPPKDARNLLSAAGLAGAVAGAVIVWQGSDGFLQTITGLWHHAVLPAFHALLISGLELCS
jgi:hypothetical protein